MQIGILEREDFSPIAIEDLQGVGEIGLFSGEDLDSFLVDKEVLFIRLKYFLDKSFFDKAKSLKYIATPTTGLNHIDLDECSRRGIIIFSLKGEYQFLSTIRATPEHTFGLILALLRNYKGAFLDQTNRAWNRELYKGYELYNNRVGIIGLGRVGKILAQYFKVFGAEVYFYDIDNSIMESEGIQRVYSMDELIDRSKIVILSTSYSVDNHQFFDKKYIDLLQDRYFVNTARGELIDEVYLMKKLEEDFFMGVALDVIQQEQTTPNLERLLSLTKSRNFILTPHIAGATYSSMHRTEEFIVRKLLKHI